MSAIQIEEVRKRRREYMHRWKAANPERARQIARESCIRCREATNARRRLNGSAYRAKYKVRITAEMKRWAATHHLETAEKSRQWRQKNPELSKAVARKSRLKHRERILAGRRERRRLNINGTRDKDLEWNQKNRDRRAAAARARYQKYSASAGFRIEAALRARIVGALRGLPPRRTGKKAASTLKLLGCSIDDLKLYLESKFESGMSWENYGSHWHIDHIMPCAIFDLTKPEHQKRCFHFSNLQPLWVRDNICKGAKVLTNQFNLL